MVLANNPVQPSNFKEHHIMSTQDTEPANPPKSSGMSQLLFLALAAGIGAAASLAVSRSGFTVAAPVAEEASKSSTAKSTAPVKIDWLAAAPGRIEPRTGLVRVGAQLLGRIADVTVKLNDTVEDGELLIRLDDDEARARLQAAETEAASRKRERDAQPLDKAREEVRKAEDAVFSAERSQTNARFELEYELQAKRQGNGSDARITDARANLASAKTKLQKERAAYATSQAKTDVPAPSRLESALQASRSDVSVAEALLEKTRIRAPVAGTILQLPAKAGEMVAPSPDLALAVIGDMSLVRLKAEVDEHDVAKIKTGGKVTVKSNAYPGREFQGTVAALAPTLASPKFALRGARRPTDVEVLEVTIDLEGEVPLLPGMRADAFFK
jgi:HlyD family secretion protein